MGSAHSTPTWHVFKFVLVAIGTVSVLGLVTTWPKKPEAPVAGGSAEKQKPPLTHGP
jgi:hypothetical protein